MNLVKYGIKFVNKLKILGITFSNECNASDLNENYEARINNLMRICSQWSNRDLSLLGKITILKTFGISQFVYLMQSIGIDEDRLDKINRIFFKFIWQKRFSNRKAYERVKRKVMYTDKEMGGLNMFNIK